MPNAFVNYRGRRPSTSGAAFQGLLAEYNGGALSVAGEPCALPFRLWRPPLPAQPTGAATALAVSSSSAARPTRG